MSNAPKPRGEYRFRDLMIPTNPDFNWEEDPSVQPEYVNPVTLNNRVILWTNVMLDLSRQQTLLYRRIAAAKVALQQAKDTLLDFEQRVLQANPPSSTATKSLKALDAHIQRSAAESNQGEAMASLVAAVRTAQQELTTLEVRLESCKSVWQSLRLAGEHAMVHLSFVKSEDRYARGRQT